MAYILRLCSSLVQKFRTGGYNVIVATSIGEEGLDIMEVDLVICFDANISPLRMIQRMGRTGRNHDGRVDIHLLWHFTSAIGYNSFIEVKFIYVFVCVYNIYVLSSCCNRRTFSIYIFCSSFPLTGITCSSL